MNPWEMSPTGASAELAVQICALVPRLETERLILRAPVLPDFETFNAIFESERSEWMGGPFDRSGAWDEFTECASGWLLRGHGAWAIEDRATGDTLGFTLVHMEFGDREPELGWFLTEAAEGHGYALEAAGAARRFAHDTLQLTSLVSYIDPPNARSTSLAKRLGAKRDQQAETAFSEDVQVWRHWGPANKTGGQN